MGASEVKQIRSTKNTTCSEHFSQTNLMKGFQDIKMKKRIFPILLLVIMTSASAVSAAPQIRLNNYVIDFGEDQAAEEIEGELYIPLRKIGELCHFEIDWKDGFAVISGEDDEYRIAANSDIAYKNGAEEKLSEKTYILNDRMLISKADAKNVFKLYDDLDQKEGEIGLHQNFKFNDAGFYDLVTTFTGDAKTQRGFSWEAELDYDDMILQYKKSGEADDKLSEVVPSCEKAAVAWANNKTYEEVPVSVYDLGDYSYSYASMFDHRLFYKAELKDLEAGTEYVYRIGSKSKDDFSEFYTFKTEAEDENAFSMIGVTDPQGRTIEEYAYYAKTLNTALEECNDPAFILNCGDFTDNAYYDDWWRYFFESSKGTCEGIPLMTAVGNHDVRGDSVRFYNYHFNNPQNAKGLSEGFVPSKGTTITIAACIKYLDNTVYSFDYGNAHFAVVNTGSDHGNAIELLSLQKEWLKNDLQNTDKKWKILATHRGIYAEKPRNQTPKEAFLDIVDECGVDLVLEGHDHTYMRTHKMKGDKVSEEGTIYALIGSAALKRYDATDVHEWVEVVKPLPKELPNYVVISFDDDKISYTAKLIDGTELDSFEIEK